MRPRLLSITVMMVVAWLLILLGTVVIFEFIVPLELGLGETGAFAEGVVKVIASAALVGVWVFILYWMTKVYVRRRVVGSRGT